MSRKYKFYNKKGLYFVSFATVNWIDVFTRDLYSYTMVESLDFCRKQKGMPAWPAKAGKSLYQSSWGKFSL